MYWLRRLREWVAAPKTTTRDFIVDASQRQLQRKKRFSHSNGQAVNALLVEQALVESMRERKAARMEPYIAELEGCEVVSV